MPETISPIKLTLAPMPAQIEAQLYNDYLRPLAGQVIKKVYDYLSANAGGENGASELEGCAPLVAAAVQRFQAGDYAGALQQTFGAYRYVTVLRSHNPDLPALELAAD
ncbi:MAG: hypothetical protein M3340_11530 [Actinomycetota bacterium]|nr:hypothetical protein [Actinomycetota bacterium]